MDKSQTPAAQPPSQSWNRWIFAAFMGIALFLLLSEHRAHVLGWVLHVLVGACVLLLYFNTRAYESDRGDGATPKA